MIAIQEKSHVPLEPGCCPSDVHICTSNVVEVPFVEITTGHAVRKPVGVPLASAGFPTETITAVGVAPRPWVTVVATDASWPPGHTQVPTPNLIRSWRKFMLSRTWVFRSATLTSAAVHVFGF